MCKTFLTAALLSTLAFAPTTVRAASRLDMCFGTSVIQNKDDDVTYGASVLAKWSQYIPGRIGYFAQFRSVENIVASEVMGGIGWQFNFGSSFLELAAGGTFSIWHGLGLVAAPTLGTKLSDRWRFSVSLYTPTSSYWEIRPYIGYQF